jgi:predicted transcriptional regulator
MEIMEVRLSPEVQAKLEELARESGQSTDAVVEAALLAHFEELTGIRETLDRRYDDLKSGRVKGIPGDEALARLLAKSEARRTQG